MKQQLIQKELDILKEVIKESSNITNGYAVGVKETKNCTSLSKAIQHSLNKFLQIGGWLDPKTKVMYYDSVRIYENKQCALDFAKANQQECIYDLKNNKELKV